MPAAIFYLIAALGFGFVIFIHELGHFVFAKWAGVKVLVFSIGFGPKLVRRTIGETEYAISLLPFGGYVKMLGQDDDPSGPAPTAAEAADPRNFVNAPVKWKVAIMFGGVLFNFLSSYLILIVLAFHGMPVVRPQVGEFAQQITDRTKQVIDSPAYRLGLKQGDHISEIYGETVRSFDDISSATIFHSREPLQVTVQRRAEANPRLLPEDHALIFPVYNSGIGFPVLAIEPPESNRIEVVAATSSDPANPQPGERVVTFDGAPVDVPGEDPLCGQEITSRLLMKLGTSVTLTLEKDHQTRTTAVIYAGDGENVELTGFPVQIEKVVPGSNADKAGLRRGDLLLALEGTAIASRQQLMYLLRSRLDQDQSCRLTLLRPHYPAPVGSTAAAQAASPSPFAPAPVTAPDAASSTTAVAPDADGHLEITLGGGEVEGRTHELGIGLGTLDTGLVRALPTLVDGSPSPLALSGVAVGDTIISYQDADAAADAPRTVMPTPHDEASGTPHARSLQVLHGGSQILIPISEDALDFAQAFTPLPFWARMLGMAQPTSLMYQIAGTQVQDGPGLAPGFIRVRGATGGQAWDVDLRDLDRQMPGLISNLHAQDWIIGPTVSDQGLALEILRGAGGSPRLLPYNPGVAFGFGREYVPYHLHNWQEAFTMVNTTAYNMVVKTLQLIPRFFRSAEDGGVSANKNLQGPIGMFRMLKTQAQLFGLASYLKLVAVIGLNLFIVNLLPIPITDGGQLLILGVETAIGRPLPTRLAALLQWLGVVLVIMLMLYVLGLDISRLF